MGFLGAAIELCSDEVINVRIVACSIFCRIKQSLKLPEDGDTLDRVNAVAVQLMADTDADVAAAARRALEEYKALQGKRASISWVMSESGFLAADRKKEQEENQWTAREDRRRSSLNLASFSCPVPSLTNPKCGRRLSVPSGACQRPGQEERETKACYATGRHAGNRPTACDPRPDVHKSIPQPASKCWSHNPKRMPGFLAGSAD
eukprot:scaffold604_cov384-Prasinococcus_capsulatus_cf.AAC.44